LLGFKQKKASSCGWWRTLASCCKAIDAAKVAFAPGRCPSGALGFATHRGKDLALGRQGCIMRRVTLWCGYELIGAVQQLYFIVAARAFFIPLGIVVLGSDPLPRLLGYLAVLLRAAFAIAGVLTLLSLEVPPAVQLAASVQVVWWLAAALALMVRTVQAPGGPLCQGTHLDHV